MGWCSFISERPRVAGLVALGVAICGGCTALVNVDKFHAATNTTTMDGSMPPTEGGSALYADLVITLTAMIPHDTHYFEYRVIDQNNVVQVRGALDPTTVGTTLIAPRAVPRFGGPYRLDYFAETSDNNHTFDEPDGSPESRSIAIKDHSWRVGPPLEDWSDGPMIVHQDGLVQVQFVHSALFTDIDTDLTGAFNPPTNVGNDVTASLVHLDKYQGDLFELRVYDPSTGHNLGLYRFSSLSAPTLMLTIAGIVDVGVEYSVDIYIDANHNGMYDNPATGGGDLGWRLALMSTSSGLQVNFDPTTLTTSNIDVGAP
jgi:hypothetical protein